MHSNNTQANLSDDRRKEFQRQQERLKAMAAISEKSPTVSADMMIQDLLRNSFKTPQEKSTTVEQLDHSYGELPLWLQHNSAAVPPEYRYLWSIVQSTANLADTQKVSQILLTSSLQVDILGFIWNLANRAVPGQLTKQEFFITLALVSLVQNGYTFNSLDILKVLTVPIVPVLQLGLVKFPVPQSDTSEKKEITTAFSPLKEVPSSMSFQSNVLTGLGESEKGQNHVFSNGVIDITSLSDNKKNSDFPKPKNESNLLFTTNYNSAPSSSLTEQTIDMHKNSNFPCIGSSPTAELEDDFTAFQSVSTATDNVSKKVSQSAHDSSDDFSEFQSAKIEHADPFETVVINQKREIPRIPLPKTLTGKFTSTKSSILKISPESGKKLKALSAPESLSSLPESKISSNNKVSTSVSMLGSNHGIGSRLANHSFSTRLDKPKCHKHRKIKINSNSPAQLNSDSEIIFGVNTKNLETVIPMCRRKNPNSCMSFILKETKIGSDDSPEVSNNELPGIELEPPVTHSGEQTRQIEIPMLGTFNETVLPTQSKASISNVDLISVQEDKYSALREIELELNKEKDPCVKETSDDFGDFLSADICDFSAPKTSQPITDAVDSNSDLLLKNEEKGAWGDWIESPLSSSDLTSGPATSTSNSAVTENTPVGPENDLFDSFNSLAITNDAKAELQPNSFMNELDCFGGDVKFDNSQVLFGGINENTNDLVLLSKANETDSSQSQKEFWGFLNPESTLPNENIFDNISDSPPNLDLNLPNEDSDQELIWKKCLDSCHGLIQEGSDIFNNIRTKSVLDEVFSAPETEAYLNNLNTVCQIAKRVSQNLSTFSESHSELEKLWEKLQDLCFEYNIKLKVDEDSVSDGKFRCSICLGHVGQDVINQSNHSYHPSCANLWINCIEKILPTSV